MSRPQSPMTLSMTSSMMTYNITISPRPRVGSDGSMRQGWREWHVIGRGRFATQIYLRKWKLLFRWDDLRPEEDQEPAGTRRKWRTTPSAAIGSPGSDVIDGLFFRILEASDGVGAVVFSVVRRRLVNIGS